MLAGTNMKSIKTKLPPLGLRIIKSAIAVILCFAFYFIRGEKGIPFYSALAALWCMQPYKYTAWNMAKQRTIGTAIGALFGAFVLAVELYILPQNPIELNPLYLLITSLTIIPIIYFTVLIDKKNASYFSCVVFLSITAILRENQDPFLFVLNRVIDTMTGIIIGVSVNTFELPKKLNKDTLFISALDDALVFAKDTMSPYTKYELNKLIQKGMKFTIATIRTPASLLPTVDGVPLNLPVVSMDGALLYDINKNAYVEKCPLMEEDAKEIYALFKLLKLNAFFNQLRERTLILYHGDFTNEAEEKIYQELRTSPYRNYFHDDPTNFDNILYIMAIHKTDVINALKKEMDENGMSDRFKILIYPSRDYTSYSYIKIYHKDATKQNRIEELKKIAGVQKVVTIGTIPGKYDVVVDGSDVNKTVKLLKKMYCTSYFKKVSD